MPTIPYAFPGSHCFQHKSLCFYMFPNTQTPYAGEASQQFQHFLMLVQAPDTSHANPYACTGSQQFKQLLMPAQASNSSHANPYYCTGF
ncbi:hypothetical protein O181_118317 [Austropuccinia psidii MF-1]|uniref:Uncharacterized protein n=1 Tax=Austropuccinia psidii MF-1 TaxID=1389203 RepID=A0A9Q3Q0A6_9BASI|nr:hypothetical protein [Austropuccinia psidii MF-1]